jgi:dTDP-glucose pyrophosphorylase
MVNIKQHILSKKNTVKQALDRLNQISFKSHLTLFVIDENEKLIGTVTDGDIRRGLLKNINLTDSVSQLMNTSFQSLLESDYSSKTIDTLRKIDLSLIPVLDNVGQLVKILDISNEKTTLPIEAFIMAGGKGSRLKPLTDTIPKPLLIIGDKPIIEHNIDRLTNYGIEKIHISIKYLGQQLVDYFGNGDKKNITINYIEENEPLGTIGSMSLVNDFNQDTVLLMNSDLLTNIDISDMYNEFISQNSDLMVATIPYKVGIPYAVMETKDNKVTSFKEKPTYTYQSNAGIYLFKKEVIELIPKNTFFNATDLMEKMIESNKNINYYPILSYWLDIGKHEDYKKAQEDIRHITL